MEATTRVRRECEGTVVRVVIENFNNNMTAREMECLWKQQELYVDMIERKLREGEEEAWRRTSQREHKLITRLIKKDQELLEMTAKVARLEASLTRGSIKLRQDLRDKIQHDHSYITPLQGAGPEISVPIKKDQTSKSTQTFGLDKSVWRYSEDEMKNASLLLFLKAGK